MLQELDPASYIEFLKEGEINDPLIHKSQNIREGWLFKEGQKINSWKKRWFLLTQTELSYYTSEVPKILTYK